MVVYAVLGQGLLVDRLAGLGQQGEEVLCLPLYTLLLAMGNPTIHYLSLDIDLTRIQTRHRALRIFLDAFGFVKIPAPGFRFSPSDGLGVCAICG